MRTGTSGTGIETDAVGRMVGADALDAFDDRIGEVSQVYVDAETDRPTWVSVRLGLLSTIEVMVPLEHAEWDDRTLHLSVDRQLARSAPKIEADAPLTDREQERLYAHYGIPSVRHPRIESELFDVADGDVCYSIHEEQATEQSVKAA